MSQTRDEIKADCIRVNEYAAARDVISSTNTFSALMQHPGMQLLDLVPVATVDSNVLRYGANVGAAANTIFGIICPKAAELIVYNEAGNAWKLEAAPAGGIAPISSSTFYLPIDATATIKPNESLFVEIWQGGARALSPKGGFQVILGQAS